MEIYVQTTDLLTALHEQFRPLELFLECQTTSVIGLNPNALGARIVSLCAGSPDRVFCILILSFPSPPAN
jgi:hypothetical protein